MVIIAKDQVREPLFVVVPYQNSWRWKSRAKHTARAIKHFADAGAVVYLVEVGFNRRELVFEDCGLDGTLANCEVIGADHNFRHRYIGLHSQSELWLKENMINVGVQHLTAEHYDWQQVAWLDSDIHFLRPNIMGETIHKLQHYAFVQMFSQAHDLGPNYEMLPDDYPHASGVGFAHAWHEGAIRSSDDKIHADITQLGRDVKKLRRDEVHNPSLLKRDAAKAAADAKKLQLDISYPGPPRVWPGLAWAATRKAWDDVGGLMDVAIWGGGDWHAAHALIEKKEGMMREDLHHNYKKIVDQWYQRCRTHIRRNVGVVSGVVTHHWHGKKSSRGYNSKHALLSQFGFDPPRHLKKDAQGLYMLHDDRSTAFVQIRDMMRRIAVERNEDSIEI